jgi:sugar fermentation stimulation protein A
VSEQYRPFESIQRAIFVERPNRFVAHCRLGDELVRAYLPNPGRLRELLLPDVEVFLTTDGAQVHRATAYTLVAVRRGRHPIMLHTHRNNDVARFLVEQDRGSPWPGARVLAAEHRVGRSRFDFLLDHQGRNLLLEVKSCTLVNGQVAMFPDAITLRGARHVAELAELAEGGTATAVLFVVHWPEARIFAPDYHTDLAFAQALLAARHHVDVKALAVGWDDSLALRTDSHRGSIHIPWDRISHEAHDRGSYLLLLRLSETVQLDTGALGSVTYRAGYYIYVGSAQANLTRRVDRHRRLRKRHHWHIDWLRNQAEFVEALPIRTSADLECDVASALRQQCDWQVPRFGSSDCRCPGHLLAWASDPRQWPWFHDTLARFRMDTLAES